MRAALRFIHVMRRHKQRHPLAGKFEEQIPQLAPGHRIDTRRRLVEEKNARLVHERASHGQPLPPATGEQARAAVEVRLEMRQLD